jgi:membrane fusion protein (multidrug efflux system)
MQTKPKRRLTFTPSNQAIISARADRSSKGALLIPQRAVTEWQGSFQVAVVGNDNKASIRQVKIGERSGSI